jgi:recombination protein RecA
MPVALQILPSLARELGLRQAPVEPARAPRWSHAEVTGRLTEVSGQGAHSSLSSVVPLILDAQAAGEPCAWVSRTQSCFFPPDLARSGVDLASLAVIFAPEASAVARAASRLARSGGFGLVILDLGAEARLPAPLQGRLSGLSIKHGTALVMLTEKLASSASLGSMISLRVEAQRVVLDNARFEVRLVVLKDKRRGPGWAHEEVLRAPPGLR